MTAHVDVSRSVRSGAAKCLQRELYACAPWTSTWRLSLGTIPVIAVEALVRWPTARVAGLENVVTPHMKHHRIFHDCKELFTHLL